MVRLQGGNEKVAAGIQNVMIGRDLKVGVCASLAVRHILIDDYIFLCFSGLPAADRGCVHAFASCSIPDES